MRRVSVARCASCNMTFVTHGGHIEEGNPRPRIETLYRGNLYIRYVQVLLPIVLLASDHLTAPDDVFYLSWDH
jgi:hypothetical protein